MSISVFPSNEVDMGIWDKIGNVIDTLGEVADTASTVKRTVDVASEIAKINVRLMKLNFRLGMCNWWEFGTKLSLKRQIHELEAQQNQLLG